MANNPNARANLIPAKKGEVRNPKGRPKGIQNWSVIVRNLLADETLADKLLKKKPGWWDDLPNKNGASAIVVAMITRAISGDVQSARWLRETGYANELDDLTKERIFVPVAVFSMKSPKAQPNIVEGEVVDGNTPADSASKA